MTVTGLFRRLEALDAGVGLRRVSLLIDSDHLAASDITLWLSTLDTESRRTVLARSVERPTHVKWFVAESEGGCVAWLHQYKEPPLSAGVGQFARSVHDHRYSFVSRVIRGALQVQDYALAGEMPRLRDESWIRADWSYAVEHTDIHCVTAWEPDTITLVIQAPPSKHHSTVYDLESGTSVQVGDLEARLPGFVDVLRAPDG